MRISAASTISSRRLGMESISCLSALMCFASDMMPTCGRVMRSISLQPFCKGTVPISSRASFMYAAFTEKVRQNSLIFSIHSFFSIHL